MVGGFIWNLFSEETPPIPRDSVHKIVETGYPDTFIDKDYAELGVSEGWLRVYQYNLDALGTEIIRYRHV